MNGLAGEPDEREPWTAGWWRHEAIVPAGFILEDLEKAGGAAAFGVEVRHERK